MGRDFANDPIVNPKVEINPPFTIEGRNKVNPSEYYGSAIGQGTNYGQSAGLSPNPSSAYFIELIGDEEGTSWGQFLKDFVVVNTDI